MKVKLKYFPEDIQQRYDLQSKVTSDGYVYIHIKRSMYGLKQATYLAYEHLKQQLYQYG